MEEVAKSNDDLAAALFYLLGESVPHKRAMEEQAKQLQQTIGDDRESLLLKVIELCGEPTTPKQLYLVVKAYSWLGKKYYEQIVRYAGQYLKTVGWSELPQNVRVENGIKMNCKALHRASILMDLARAQEGLGHLDSALTNFMEAYRITPYSAMNAIKVADVLVKLNGKEEALFFLNQQKKSKYYDRVKYVDLQGRRQRNELFRQLLDAHILKLQKS